MAGLCSSKGGHFLLGLIVQTDALQERRWLRCGQFLCSNILYGRDLYACILLPPDLWPEILLGPDLCSRILHAPDLPVLLHGPDLRLGILCGLRLGILCERWLGILYGL